MGIGEEKRGEAGRGAKKIREKGGTMGKVSKGEEGRRRRGNALRTVLK